MTRNRTVAALSGIALLTLAACASVPAGQSPAQTAATGVAQPRTSEPANLLSANAAPTNEQRAEQDAAAILAAFTAPPGAQRLNAAPSVSGGVLNRAGQTPVTPAVADKAAWWRAAGSPKQVLAWVSGHLPHGFTPDGGGTTSDGTAGIWFDGFELPPVAGVLSSRQLVVEAVSAGGGRTDIRVDAQVTWLSARGPGETIPAGATTVTLALTPAASSSKPQVTTVSNPAEIRQLTALINRLPAFPAGNYSCPIDGLAKLVLTFGAGQGRPARAVATVKLQGCEGVDLAVSGVAFPALGPLDGGRQTAAQALKIAGLNWKLPA